MIHFSFIFSSMQHNHYFVLAKMKTNVSKKEQGAA